MDLASAEAEIRHVFGDTPITEASIGAAPPDILVKLSDTDRELAGNHVPTFNTHALCSGKCNAHFLLGKR